MNILLVASPLVSLRRPFNGGTESFIVHLANQLCHVGHRVDVLAKDADETDLFQVIEFEESPYSMKDDLHTETEGQNLFLAMQFALMDTSRYDIVHFNSYMPLLFDAFSLRQQPSIITLHTPPDDRYALLHRFHSERQPAAEYVCVSERLAKAWMQKITTRITVIENGIDHDEVHSALNAPISHASERSAFLWIGRICEDKNPLDAIRLARAKNQLIKLAGPIGDAEYFRNNVEPHLGENCQYLGHLSSSELYKTMAASRLLIASARWEEPFGLAVLEAMSLGTPVAGYSSAIAPELRAPKAVAIAAEDNLAGMCEAADVIEVHLLDGERLSDAAQVHSRRFNIDRMTAKYLHRYKQSIDSNANVTANANAIKPYQSTDSATAQFDSNYDYHSDLLRASSRKRSSAKVSKTSEVS